MKRGNKNIVLKVVEKTEEHDIISSDEFQWKKVKDKGSDKGILI